VRLDGLDSASAARLLDTSAVAVRLRCLRATQSLKAAIV
jgi:DNA-directed RNA polymerase specialized sigma24 family protein